MYEVRNAKNEIVSQTEILNVAKERAQSYADLDKDYNRKNPHGPFNIWEVKQVWTTQTLDEAMKA